MNIWKYISGYTVHYCESIGGALTLLFFNYPTNNRIYMTLIAKIGVDYFLTVRCL